MGAVMMREARKWRMLIRKGKQRWWRYRERKIKAGGQIDKGLLNGFEAFGSEGKRKLDREKRRREMKMLKAIILVMNGTYRER